MTRHLINKATKKSSCSWSYYCRGCGHRWFKMKRKYGIAAVAGTGDKKLIA